MAVSPTAWPRPLTRPPRTPVALSPFDPTRLFEMLLPAPLSLADVSIGMERGCRRISTTAQEMQWQRQCKHKAVKRSQTAANGQGEAVKRSRKAVIP